jgi:hypothetical protein
MSKGKQPDPVDPILAAAAAEELGHAAALTWTELSRVLPWGDAFEGFAPDGSEVTFERAYVWAEAIGGDILCEVTAFRGEPGFEAGVTASRLIRCPA